MIWAMNIKFDSDDVVLGWGVTPQPPGGEGEKGDFEDLMMEGRMCY